MSINDPIILRYNDKKEYFYLTQGRETFYDQYNYMWVFDTEEEAAAWSEENIGKTPIKEYEQGELL
jgi:hypothetical protein